MMPRTAHEEGSNSDDTWLQEYSVGDSALISHLTILERIWADLTRERINRAEYAVDFYPASATSTNLQSSIVVFCASRAIKDKVCGISKLSDWTQLLVKHGLHLFVIEADHASGRFDVSTTEAGLLYELESRTGKFNVSSAATGKSYVFKSPSTTMTPIEDLQPLHNDPQPQSAQSCVIREQSKNCLTVFESISAEHLRKRDDWCESRQADFRAWAAGLGAMADGRASLDWRLRDHNDVRDVILGLLANLQMTLGQYRQQLSMPSKRANFSLSPKPEAERRASDIGVASNGELSSGSISPWSNMSPEAEEERLPEQLHSADSMLTTMNMVDIALEQLSRLGVAIRRSGTHWRYLKADKNLDVGKYHDLSQFLETLVLVKRSYDSKTSANNIISLYLTDSPKLSPIQQRLISANVIRRNRFMYAREVYKARAEDISSLTKKDQIESNATTLRLTQEPNPSGADPIVSPKSTTSKPDLGVLIAPKSVPVRNTPSATDIGSQFAHTPKRTTSAMSTISKQTATGTKLEYPPLPQISDPRRKTFECPVCWQTLPVEFFQSDSTWRGHIDRDVLPYICIFEDCEAPNQLYAKKAEWSDHLAKYHSRQEWACSMCFEVYESADSFSYHLSHAKQHKGAFEPDEISILTTAASRQASRHLFDGLEDCPLCHSRSLLRSGQSMFDHVAEHVHDFALYSLPWNQDLQANSALSARLNASGHTASEVSLESLADERQILGRTTRLRYMINELTQDSDVLAEDFGASYLETRKKGSGGYLDEILEWVENWIDTRNISGKKHLFEDEIELAKRSLTKMEQLMKSLQRLADSEATADNAAVRDCVKELLTSVSGLPGHLSFLHRENDEELSNTSRIHPFDVSAPYYIFEKRLETAIGPPRWTASQRWTFLLATWRWLHILSQLRRRSQQSRPVWRGPELQESRGSRIIVGIDYGTTYSGISYVTSNKDSVDDIVVISRWPNRRDNTWKAPTTIAYASENEELTENQWGFGTQGLKQYAWTKLLFDENNFVAEFDDPLLKEMYGQGFLSLPRGKSAKDVAKDYLQELYKYLMQVLERELSAAILRIMPMECWITTPAIWSDRAISDTLQAAKAAGFGSRPNDSTINIISDPEAAALAALKPYLEPKAIDPVQPNECVLICDCGGVTVDITTFQVLENMPLLRYQEICMGAGGKCGSTSIDRNFIRWMTRKFGSAYTSIGMKKRGSGSRFMTSFENAKRNFRMGGGNTDSEIGPIRMYIPQSELYDEDEEFVKLSSGDMASLFDPSLNQILNLLEAQEASVKKTTGKNIDRLILVGGFGDSAYLQQKLKEWCERKAVRRFCCPVDCQAAIVKGAALRGLEKATSTITIARRHYGWSLDEVFREGIDDEKYCYIDSYDGSKRCHGKMHWVVKKGQELDESTVTTVEMRLIDVLKNERMSYSKTLYSSTLSIPADRMEHYSVMPVGVIVLDVSGLRSSDMESRYSSTLDRNVTMCRIKIEMRFRSQKGTIAFRTLVSGRELAETTISYAG